MSRTSPRKRDAKLAGTVDAPLEQSDEIAGARPMMGRMRRKRLDAAASTRGARIATKLPKSVP